MLSCLVKSIPILQVAIRTFSEGSSTKLTHWVIKAIESQYFMLDPDLAVGSYSYRVNDKLEEIFKASGLKVARQQYEYTTSSVKYTGENVYAILHAPRGDATEAIVLVG